MKLLFDLFPVILFFAAYQLGERNPEMAQATLAALGIDLHAGVKPGVFLATLVAIAATVLQIVWTWLRHRKVDTMLWVSFVLITVFGGPTLFLQNEAADVDAASAAFAGASVLLLPLECPLQTVRHAIEVAKQQQVHVILNPAPSQPLDAQLLSQVDYLVPNQIELALLTQAGSLEEGVKRLKALGVKQVVVTLGGDGVAVFDDDEIYSLPPHQVSVGDTTAAGDAFVGGFAVALVEGKSTRVAAEWGNAAGALAVTRAGAQPSLPTRAELEKFLGHR